MKTTSLIMALGIATGIFAAPAMPAGNLVQFDGGIGVIPVSSGVVVQTPQGLAPRQRT